MLLFWNFHSAMLNLNERNSCCSTNFEKTVRFDIALFKFNFIQLNLNSFDSVKNKNMLLFISLWAYT